MSKSVTDIMACQMCGVSIVKTGLRGPKPKFCVACYKSRKYQRVLLWRKANPERLAILQKRWVERHPKKAAENRKLRVARAKAIRLSHPRVLLDPVIRRENHKRSHRRWVESHRDRMAANERRRRARKRGAQGSHTVEEWNSLLVRYDGCCAYCGRSDLQLTEDHVVSIVSGGRDDISNIVPACRPCNSRKGPRPVESVLAGGGEVQ